MIRSTINRLENNSEESLGWASLRSGNFDLLNNVVASRSAEKGKNVVKNVAFTRGLGRRSHVRKACGGLLLLVALAQDTSEEPQRSGNGN